MSLLIKEIVEDVEYITEATQITLYRAYRERMRLLRQAGRVLRRR